MHERTRMAIRAALLIGEHMAGRSARTDTIRLPEHSWQQVLRLKRQSSGHTTAVGIGPKRFCSATWPTRCDAFSRNWRARSTESKHMPSPSIRSVPPSSIATCWPSSRNSMGLRSILRSHELVVTTDSIVLEDIDLGRFQIRLDWSQIGSARQPYRVVASIRTLRPVIKTLPILTSRMRASVKARAARRLPTP